MLLVRPVGATGTARNIKASGIHSNITNDTSVVNSTLVTLTKVEPKTKVVGNGTQTPGLNQTVTRVSAPTTTVASIKEPTKPTQGVPRLIGASNETKLDSVAVTVQPNLTTPLTTTTIDKKIESKSAPIVAPSNAAISAALTSTTVLPSIMTTKAIASTTTNIVTTVTTVPPTTAAPVTTTKLVETTPAVKTTIAAKVTTVATVVSTSSAAIPLTRGNITTVANSLVEPVPPTSLKNS